MKYFIKLIIFMDDNFYKLCVHTRRGDFIGMGESKQEEVQSSINRVIKHIPRLSQTKHVTLLFFGEDKQFLQSLKIGTEVKIYFNGSLIVYNLYFLNKNIYNIYIQKIGSIHYIIDMKMNRIEELHFAQRTCDLLLITASLSTYAFWMGYLMPEVF